MRSNSGTERKNSSYVVLGAEAHHALDAGAVVPAAVEQHDLAAGRQMRDVALEIPLRALALARRRQRGDAADARVEPLRDALDDAALAGGIAAFEDDDDLELLVLHPVLQLHQLALQAEQLLEIEAPVDGLAGRMARRSSASASQAIVVDLQLQLLVEAVEHFRVKAIVDGAPFDGFLGHGRLRLRTRRLARDVQIQISVV